MALVRQLWVPGGGAAPLCWAESAGAVAEGAPPWRLAYVGRAALMQDFDFLISAADAPWTVRNRGDGRAWSAMVRRAGHALAAADPTPCLLVTERCVWLDAGRRPAVPPLPLGELAPRVLYATHLQARCPVAASHDAQLAQLTSPDLRARWRDICGLTHRVSRSPSDLRAFYDRMVAGQDRRRFGDSGAALPFAAFAERLAAGGALIQVFDAAVAAAGGIPSWVSGVALAPAPSGGLAVFRPGIAAADALSAPALSRLTCYHDIAALEVARQGGQRELDLGLTRALANNAIYRHKKALGATFEVAPRCPVFRIQGSLSAHQMLARHAPLVVL